MDELSGNLQQKLRAELKPNEKAVWVAQPNPSQLMKGSFLVWIFFVPWTLFTIFWIYGASGFKIPTFKLEDGFSFFPLFGLPFLFIGIAGLGSPYWLKRKALNTVYAITNQRLLVLNFDKTTKVQSYYPKDITQLSRNEKLDGTGDLQFSTVGYLDNNNVSRVRKDGFYAVADVRKVERLVEDFLKANNLIK